MRRAWVALLCVAASVGIVAAGEPSGGAFRSGVDLVALTVTVTDRRLTLISDLAEQDFAVFEDGVRQNVALFAADRAPLDLAIVLDASASMTEILPTAREAAIGCVRSLQPGDRVSVVGIHDRTEVLHPLDDDLAGAVAAIDRTMASGTTALYDSLYIVATDMQRKRARAPDIRRQAIVVLSDGADTRSHVAYDDLIDLIKDAGITIYAIQLRWPYEPSPSLFARAHAVVNPQFVMRSFALQTGGRYFEATQAPDLAGVYGRIADELAHQYTLGYISTNVRHDGTYRRVIVRVLDRPQCAARTRSGYRAPRPNPPLP